MVNGAMETDDETGRELLRRFADRSMDEDVSSDWLDGESAALDAMTDEQRRVVEERLRVLLRYEERTGTAAEALREASAALSLGKTAFYQLLSSAKRFGPVAALTKEDGRQHRAAMYRDGLPNPYEARLRQLLEENPRLRWRDAVAALESLPRERRHKVPSEATIRRRLSELERSMPRHLRVGRSITLVQAVFLMSDGYSRVAALLDDDTELLLGVAEDSEPETSIEKCVASAQRIVPALSVQQAVPFADRLESLGIALPSECDQIARKWETLANKRLPEVRLRRVEDGEARLRRIVERITPANDEASSAVVPIRFLAPKWNASVLQSDLPRARVRVDDGAALLQALATLRSRVAGESSSPRVAV